MGPSMSFKPVVLRSFNNFSTDEASLASGLLNTEPSLTQQSFRDECDINVIVERFGLTGELPEPLSPKYGDFSDVQDYHSAMNSVRSASEGFMSLPAILRSRFGNDPAVLIDFLQDPANRAEAVSLGLVNKPSLSGSEGTTEAPPKAE